MKQASIIAEFQLVDHFVEELVVRNSIGILRDEDEKAIKEISIYGVSAGSFEEYHAGKLGISLSFECSKKGNEGEKISVEVKISGEFEARISETMDADRFKQMLLGNGIATLYSISRAVIATTTAQCLSSGQVRIPMLNVLEYLASHPEKAEGMSAGKSNDDEC